MDTTSRALEQDLRSELEFTIADGLLDLPMKVMRNLILKHGIPNLSSLDDEQLIKLFKDVIVDVKDKLEFEAGMPHNAHNEQRLVEAEAQLEIHRMLTK